MTDNPYIVHFGGRNFDSRDIIRFTRAPTDSDDTTKLNILSLQPGHQAMEGKIKAATSAVSEFLYSMLKISDNTELSERPLFVPVNKQVVYNANNVQRIVYDETKQMLSLTISLGKIASEPCTPEEFKAVVEKLEKYSKQDLINAPVVEPDRSRPLPSRRHSKEDEVFDESDLDGPQGLLDGHSAKTLLKRYSRNLNLEAKAGAFDHLIAREKDLANICEVLNEHTVKSSVLLGEAGTGKTSTVEVLAKCIVEGKVPQSLRNAEIIALNLQAMSSPWAGEVDRNVAKIMDYVVKQNKKGRNIIPYIDELHAQSQVGASTNSPPISEVLKPYLTSGYLQIIGATTQDEYNTHILPNTAYKRRFGPVTIEPPNPEELLSILKLSAKKAMSKKPVVVPEAELLRCIEMSDRYVHGRAHPDKGVSILARACSIAELKGARVLDADHIAEAISKETNLKPGFILQKDKQRILELRNELPKEVLAQPQATKPITGRLIASFGGLQRRKGPLGIFLLDGPTGVGKTETARVLAKYLAGDEKKLIRIDMSDYQHLHDVDKLVEDLTKQVRANPFSVVDLDEIEKADPRVLDRLLQLFEEGQLKDGRAMTVSFANTIIIMTTNVGAERATSDNQMGFGKSTMNEEATREYYEQAIRAHFRPELLGRVDEVCIYNKLAPEHLHTLIEREMNQISLQAKEQYGVNLALTDELYDTIIAASNCDRYGARDLKSTIGKLIVTPLTIQLMEKEDELKMALSNSAEKNAAGLLISDVGDDLKYNLVFDRSELFAAHASKAAERTPRLGLGG